MIAGDGVETSLDALILAQSRTTIALLILAPLLLALKGVKVFTLSRRQLILCLLMGMIGVAGSNFFYYYSIDKTSVATAIVVQYTAPVWVLLYMVAIGRQHATRRRVLAVTLALLGIVLSVGVLQLLPTVPFVKFVGLKLHVLGVLAALGAALSFSFYNILGADLIARISRWTVFIYALLGAVLFWLIINPPWKIIAANYNGGQWLFMLVFSIFSILIPFACYFSGLRYLDATRAVVTSCLEPVFAILFATTFVGEQPGWLQALGMAAVLCATVIVQIPEKQNAVSNS